jgi:hypothetical protein
VSTAISRGIWLVIALTCLLPGQDKRSDQDALRSVHGIVTDAAGEPVANAAVLLKNTKSLQIRSFITGPDGAYHFAGLSPNLDYQVKAGAEGATSGWKTLSIFNTKKSATINLKLKK